MMILNKVQLIKIGIGLLSLLSFSCLFAQQGQTWSSYYEKGFAFNPALTAYWDNIELTASHRREWTGFDGEAPENTSIGVQIPIIPRGRTNVSSVGAFLDKDEVGPLNSVGVKLTYSYRIALSDQGGNLDQLRLGIGLNTRFNSFDMTNIIAFDGYENDSAINNTEDGNGLGVSGSVGLFYVSVDVDREYKSHYFMGLSLNNLPTSKSNIKSLGEITQSPFFTAHFGFRYLPKNRDFYIEPSIFASYSTDNEFLVMLNTRIEFKEKFYVAGGGDTNGGYFAQTGFVLGLRNVCGGSSHIRSNSRYNDYTDLRLGFKVGNRFGPISQFVGVNYEFLLAFNLASCY